MSICLRFAKCELGVRTAADVAIAVAERAPAGAVGSANHGFRCSFRKDGISYRAAGG